MRERRAGPLILLAATLLAGPWGLDVEAARPQTPRAVELKLARVEGLEHGTMAVREARTTVAGDRCLVADLDVMQPVAVRLRAVEPARAVTLEVLKGDFERVYRRCATDPDGVCEIHLRTQGDLGLRVTSPAGAGVPFELAVWVGEEVKAVPANVLTPASRVARKGEGISLTNALLAVIAVALVGLLVLVAWVVLRRRPREA
ncbi:MAG: hypothetical protein MUF10_14435 [Thermoanaerobaculaceae bacterium]|jgi:hypothetical protein|nr:hypothetical protein [Thermoanaerobaculaceae bacterium]